MARWTNRSPRLPFLICGRPTAPRFSWESVSRMAATLRTSPEDPRASGVAPATGLNADAPSRCRAPPCVQCSSTPRSHSIPWGDQPFNGCRILMLGNRVGTGRRSGERQIRTMTSAQILTGGRNARPRRGKPRCSVDTGNCLTTGMPFSTGTWLSLRGFAQMNSTNFSRSSCRFRNIVAPQPAWRLQAQHSLILPHTFLRCHSGP